jgi:dienelactone hydrolase
VDASPPQPPRTGLLDRVEELTLTGGADATIATTTSPHAPGVVLIGNDRLARALADAGVQAVAAPASAVDAGLDELRQRGTSTIYVLGLGAASGAALLHGARTGVAGIVAVDADPTGEPLAAAREGRLTAPVLALYAGGDERVDDETVEAFHAALAAAGTLQEAVVYDGAPRGFFDGSRPELADACDDAWRRILRFVGVPAL